MPVEINVDFLDQNSPKFKKTSSNSEVKIFDFYSDQLEELLEITFPNPLEKASARENFLKKTQSENRGVWVYIPWKNGLFHILNEGDYYRLRTNRNRELLNFKELDKIKNIRVGLAGLSIGSNLAYILSHLGVRNFKLADFDKLSTSNLNRVNSTLSDLGKNKAIMTAQNIFETDPYSEIDIFTESIDENNLSQFLDNGKKLGVVIDSIDDFEIKIKLRQKSRDLGIPVLMFTNLGDSTLIDIERYDLEPNLEIFNNLLGEIPKEILNSEMTEDNKKKFAVKLVGLENIPTRALESLTLIGDTLVGRPQLASTVAISAGVGSYITKKIALNEPCPSGRYLLNYSSAIFENGTKDPYSKESGRQEILENLIKTNG